MGTWGSGFFENDAALDWVDALSRARSWKPVLAALAKVEPDELPDVPLAAAAVVALGLQRPIGDVPEVASEFVARAGAPSAATVSRALQTLDAALARADALAGLWGDPEDAAAWREGVQKLSASLSVPAEPAPLPPPPDGPAVDWTQPDLAAWASSFVASTGPEGWMIPGDAMLESEFRGVRADAVRRLALAGAEVVAAVLDCPSPTTPPVVVQTARRLGMPSMWTIEVAAQTLTRVIAWETTRYARASDGVVDLAARVRGASIEQVLADPTVWNRATRVPDPPSALFAGRRRKARLEAGDLVGLQFPEGWVLGRAVPSRLHGQPTVLAWFYEGFRRAPDDLEGAGFARLWIEPRYLNPAIVRDPRFQLLDPSHRASSDGAPSHLQIGEPNALGLMAMNHRADSVEDLDNEVRYRSGAGLSALLLDLLRGYTLRGHIELKVGDPRISVRAIQRRHFRFLREPDALEGLAAPLLAEIGDPDALRRAWLAR